MSPHYQPGLISVIVPTYNRMQYVGDAVDSVIAQTYRPIEVLVVDDGSTDRTAEVISDRQNRCHDAEIAIRYLKQENSGAPTARNLGCIEAQGEFIQFLDSDDVLLPGKLESAVELLQESPFAFTYCIARWADADLQELQYTIGKDVPDDDSAIIGYPWQVHGPLYRRSLVLHAGPWAEHLTRGQDWEYGVRIRMLGYRGLFDPRVQVLVRCHDFDRVTGEEDVQRKLGGMEQAYDTAQRCAEQLDKLSPAVKKSLCRNFFFLAVWYACRGCSEERRRCFLKAYRLSRPFSWKGMAAWGLAHLNMNQRYYSLLVKVAAVRRAPRSGLVWMRSLLGTGDDRRIAPVTIPSDRSSG